MAMKYPDVAQLANAALEASKCQTHTEFVAQFGDGVIGLRTFRGWLNGESPASPLAVMVLREYVGGWRPTKG